MSGKGSKQRPGDKDLFNDNYDQIFSKTTGLGAGGKWPRHYASEIMAEPCKEKRREMFNEVPDDIKEMVMKHCKTSLIGGSNGHKQ